MKYTYYFMVALMVLALSACGKEGAVTPPPVVAKSPISAQQIQEPADPMAAYCKAHPTEGMCAMGNIGF